MRIKTDKIRRVLIEVLVFIFILEFSPISSLPVAEAQAQSDMPMVPASGSTEWQSKRTASSKTFVNANGSITTKIYPSPIHYYKNGVLSKGWEEINNNLKISESPLGLFGEKYLVNGANSFQTSYKDNASGEYFKFNVDGAQINFSLKETRNPVTGAKSSFDQIALKSVLARYQGNKVTYNQIKSGVNLTQYVLSDRVKEEITLNRYLESNVLVLSFSANNLTWTKMSDGRIVFRDVRNNKKVFSFDKPVMYDSRGGRNNIDNVYSSAINYKIVKNADKYDFIITPDNNWLKDPARIYPVIIDPTIYNGVAGDAYAEEGSPTTQTYPQRALYTGRGSTKLRTRSYIAYQLPNIGGGRILSAQANVYQYGCYGAALNYPVAALSTSQFDPNTLTWNNQPNFVQFQSEINNGGNANWLSFDVTKAAKDWYSGNSQSMPGGLGFLQSSESVWGYRVWASTDHPDFRDKLPNLTINYTDYNATYGADMPKTVGAGTAITNIPFEIKNTGNIIWPATGSQPVKLAYHLYDSQGNQILLDGLRTDLPQDVRPGDMININAKFVAPTQIGTYTIKWDVVKEMEAWFSGLTVPTLDYSIEVVPASTSLNNQRGSESYYSQKGPINISNGNLNLNESDFSIAAQGNLSLGTSRSYNSQDYVAAEINNTGYIRDWLIDGPFYASSAQNAFKTDSIGEEYLWPNEGAVNGRAWIKFHSQNDALNIHQALQSTIQYNSIRNAAVYNFIYVWSPNDKNGQIWLGSDDGIKVFVNGNQIWANNVLRGMTADSDRFNIPLKAGWNRILFKVSQGEGDFKLQAKICDSNGNVLNDLKLSTTDPNLKISSILGNKWQMDFEQRLITNDAGNVTYIDADGSYHNFSGDGINYSRPQGLFIDLIRDSEKRTHPNGTLIKTDASSMIYYLENGKKRPIPDPQIFNNNFYAWGFVIVSQAEADQYPTGDWLNFQDGTMVKYSGAPAVYVIEDGKKRHFPDPATLAGMGYKWENVAIVDDPAILDRFPNGDPIAISPKHPNGSLIRTANAPEVYYLVGGKKCHVLSPSIYYSRFISWNKVIIVSDTEMNSYSTGASVPYRDGTMFYEPSTGPAVYVVENGARRWIPSPAVFNDAGYYWGFIVTAENFAIVNSHSLASPLSVRSLKLRFKDGIYYNFDPSGRLLSKNDLNGNRISYLYEQDKVVKILDSSGREINLSYENGRLKQMTDPAGRRTFFDYDSNGYLQKAYNALNNFQQYFYDGEGKVTQINDFKNNPTYFSYDGGKVIDVKNAVSAETKFNYADGSRAEITDPLGRKVTNYLNAYKKIYAVDDGYGELLNNEFEYDGNLNPSRVIDEKGEISVFEYDNIGNRTETIDQLGNITTTTYDSFSNPLTITDPNGNITRYNYDVKEDLISQADPLGNVTNYNYDQYGNQTKVTDPKGNTTSFAYDNYGNLMRTVDAKGAATSAEYDILGNKTASIDANGVRIEYQYDTLNRESKTIDPSKNAKETQYDANSNIISQKDFKGNITSFEFDAINRLNKQINPDGSQIAYQYDLANNRTAVMDEKGKKTSYEYDDRNQVTAEIKPDGTRYTVAYDGNGNITKVIDPKGQNHDYGFDKTDQVVNSSSTSTDSNYVYDKNGNPTKIAASSDTTNITYDKNDEPLTVKNSISEDSTYIYDKNSNTSQIQTPIKNYNLTYDKAEYLTQLASQTSLNTGTGTTYTSGRLSMSSTGISEITNYEYDAAGNITKIIKPNSDVTLYTYDSSDRLINSKNQNKNGLIYSSYDLEYDANYNITRITRADGKTNSYQYDAKNQLTAENSSVYTYDAARNRTSISGDKNANYIYDAIDGNKLLRVEYADGRIINFSYDTNGNITEKNDSQLGKTTYQYDAEDYFVKAVLPSGKTIEYSYDANKQRISRLEDGNLIKYIYEGGKLVAEEDVSGTVIHSYTYDPQENLISITIGGIPYYYQYDPHGNVVGLSDYLGNLKVSYDYDAWGNLLTDRGELDNPRLYSGYYFDDDLGMYFLKTRMYDPGLGRFLSKDSDIGEGSGTLNPYAYCDNNPVMKIDQNGKFAWLIALVPALKIAVDVAILYAGWYYCFGPGKTAINNVINATLPAIASIAQTAIQKAASAASSYYKKQITTVKSVIVETNYYDTLKATTQSLKALSTEIRDAKTRLLTSAAIGVIVSNLPQCEVYSKGNKKAYIFHFKYGVCGFGVYFASHDYPSFWFPTGDWARSYVRGRGYR